jgi:hypothetical protein
VNAELASSPSKTTCAKPLAVAQIDEDALAVIAARVHPAEEHDLLADVLFAEVAAVVSALKLVDEPGHGTLLREGRTV